MRRVQRPQLHGNGYGTAGMYTMKDAPCASEQSERPARAWRSMGAAHTPHGPEDATPARGCAAQ